MKKSEPPANVVKDTVEHVPIPFNDALKKLWAAPPAPKVAKPVAKSKKKTGK